MTQSPTSQATHCPLSHPPRPFHPPLPSPPQCPAPASSCCTCPSTPSPSSREEYQNPVRHCYHQNRHHHHQDHPHYRLPLLNEPLPHRYSTTDRLEHKDLTSTVDHRPRTQHLHLHRHHCHHTLAVAASTTAAAVAAVAFKTLVRVCRTLIALWAVLLLGLLRQRRRGRRQQLSQVPRVLVTLCLLSMLTSRCLASPWVEESFHSVKLRAKVCQPVPEEHLRNMLGAAYDPSRMSNEDPHKRSDPGADTETEEAVFDSYMEDDPGAGRYVDEDLVDIVADGHGGGWFRREELQEGRIEVGKGEDFEEERGDIYEKKDVGSPDSLSPGRPDPRSQDGRSDPPSDRRPFYMRRRRRAAGDRRESASTGGSDSSNKDKKSKDSLLPLRLLLSGRNRKLRRKLKKEFRKKAKKLGKKPPPWTCTMAKVWGQLKPGYFPRYLLDGRCQTDKCFYRLYKCAPQEYKIKLLKRDPDYCNPLPALGANSTYEQKWTVVRYNVIVGCNCQAFGSPQNSSSGRRRYS